MNKYLARVQNGYAEMLSSATDFLIEEFNNRKTTSINLSSYSFTIDEIPLSSIEVEWTEGEEGEFGEITLEDVFGNTYEIDEMVLISLVDLLSTLSRDGK